MTTSLKLLKVFDHFAKPKVLAGNQRAFKYLFFILDIFNNIIQYQYEGNHKLVYAILQNEPIFRRLANLSLSDFQFTHTQVQPTQSTQQPIEQPAQSTQPAQSAQQPAQQPAQSAQQPTQSAQQPIQQVPANEWVCANQLFFFFFQ